MSWFFALRKPEKSHSRSSYNFFENYKCAHHNRKTEYDSDDETTEEESVHDNDYLNDQISINKKNDFTCIEMKSFNSSYNRLATNDNDEDNSPAYEINKKLEINSTKPFSYLAGLFQHFPVKKVYEPVRTEYVSPKIHDYSTGMCQKTHRKRDNDKTAEATALFAISTKTRQHNGELMGVEHFFAENKF